MGIETMESSWFNTIWKSSRKPTILEPERPLIGIMSFEVSRLMTKVANLWQFLTHKQMTWLQDQLSNSLGTQKLVSDDHNYLMELALLEILDNIKCVAQAVARLGKKSMDPIYNNLDHIFDNPMEIDVNWCGWEYRLKKMEKRVKKMKRFTAVTSQLYEELEVLHELENDLKIMQENNTDQMKLHEFQKKVAWQHEEVADLREMSVWVRSYDYILRLLVRSLLTIVNRVKGVFGITRRSSGHISRGGSDIGKGNCFARSNSISALVSVYPFERDIKRSASNLGDKAVKSRNTGQVGSGCVLLDSKKRLFQKPTLGDAGLSLHYANVIIFIERLAIAPHFICPEAREDLYQMLTTRIKNSFRVKIKNEGVKVYSRDLAYEWSSLMQKTLNWLAPLAHNMIKWHSERNFEKQRMGLGGIVLLVNTLHYADQVKCEDAITELVMGLHYVSRFGREINDKAFVGCGYGGEFDDYLVHKCKIDSIELYD
ncbi:protein PSK SIMULATOR 1 [Lactuca sativa]|uniref:DUF668 domain-containing protein n=1 Tax=Lactuca sativa TaxID=4236 RepID=A0A9R1WQV2_LACSA|nr:protein PSK SIMULATOR 1 [Lactuca sativa]XP_023758083.1 protein PSK SIMULATOR 1 [Lactuca sativa]KAJ0228074.1 hypothetical protein LSAT_V11C100020800 [Lactuca sativa]